MVSEIIELDPMDYLPDGTLTKGEQAFLENLENCTVIHDVNSQRFQNNIIPALRALEHQQFAQEMQELFQKNKEFEQRLSIWAARIAEEQWIPSEKELKQASELSVKISGICSRIYYLYSNNWTLIHAEGLPDQTALIIKVEQNILDFQHYIGVFIELSNYDEMPLF